MRLGQHASSSDPGRRRRHNEDAFVVRPPLFAIADGMGGAQAGEVASRLAAAVLRESDGAGTGEDRVADLIREANRRVFERANEDAATEGMGTTMTVALVDEARGTITIGHVGDSRAYRLRSDELDQLTEDHSLVQELVRSGKLSPEEADVHPQRAVITRAVGTEPDVDVDTFTVEAEAGDLYLLCSDGLTDMVNEDVVHAAVVAHREELDAAARALVAAANRVGGEDNITVVLFELVADGLGDTQAYEPAVGGSAAGADEDTLDELDAVPVVDTAVISAEDVRREVEAAERARDDSAEQPAPAAKAPKRRRHGAGGGSRWPALIAVVLAVGVIAALVVWGLLR